MFISRALDDGLAEVWLAFMVIRDTEVERSVCSHKEGRIGSKLSMFGLIVVAFKYRWLV